MRGENNRQVDEQMGIHRQVPVEVLGGQDQAILLGYQKMADTCYGIWSKTLPQLLGGAPDLNPKQDKLPMVGSASSGELAFSARDFPESQRSPPELSGPASAPGRLEQPSPWSAESLPREGQI